MTHTKTPWKYLAGLDGRAIVLHDSKESLVAIGDFLKEEDAEHIVKSVNEYDKLKASHQELLEAAIAVISVADRKTKEFDRLKEATSNAKELG